MSNSSFSTILPSLQLAWDSTSLGAFKACPRRYQYTIIEGYVPPGESVDLRFGIEYHSALENYHRARGDGKTHEEATISAVRSTLIATWDTELDRPWSSEDPNKNRETLIRSVIYYLDTFKEDSLTTLRLESGETAVELSFRIELEKEAPTGERYVLCGHFDRVVMFIDGIRDLDYKTTKKTLNAGYFAQYSPNNQISCYSYSSKIVFGAEAKAPIIDGAQILVNDTVFQRNIIERTESQLEEWINDVYYYISLAEIAAQRNYWPANDTACGGWVDPNTGELRYGCPFRIVCGAAPEVRKQILEGNFEKRVWDPLKPRERKQE